MEEKWKTYEEVSASLICKFAPYFGLIDVKGKQVIRGDITSWEIDAKGMREGNKGFMIIECRRYTTTKQTQAKLAALAFQIEDTGAHGGIIVSPMAVQSGAAKIAKSKDIIVVNLSADSTVTDFVMKFLNRLMVGIGERAKIGDTASITFKRNCKKCGELFTVAGSENICPNCARKTG
jgi:hypothetical protein